MYSTIQLAKKYLDYYLHASNSKGHGMHSPFVFGFILNVLNNKNHYQSSSQIEALRKQLLTDQRMLEVEDLGAGSRSGSHKTRSVKQIANSALKSKRLAQLLFRLVKHYQPETIVELGTSLGMTTSYFSNANPDATIITIEGSEAVAAIAKENFEKLNCKNIRQLRGNFDEVLPLVLNELSSIDLAYIDGNHRYAPSINYFHQFLDKSGVNTILIFDDIHWSEEMEKAWEEIKSHSSVKYTIDIFSLGFVFFRDEFKVKQHFSIRF